MSRRAHIKRAKTLRKLWYEPMPGGSGAGYVRDALCPRRRRIAHAVRSAYR